jgi:hypothetical protein
MFKWLNYFSIFKFDWLLDFAQCNICDNNFFNMESFVIIEREKLLIYALLVSHNHAQQTTLKTL